LQVLTALRFFAKGGFLSEIADLHGMCRSSASRCIASVTDSLNHRLPQIKFPTSIQEKTATKTAFFQIAGMPNIIGAIDGTLIPIIAPSKDEPLFVCRKGYHALNVQAVADASLRWVQFTILLYGKRPISKLPKWLKYRGVWIIKVFELLERLPYVHVSKKYKLSANN
jgi:hypothetical protein